MKRVEVDFNERGRDGLLVRAPLKDADLRAGEDVAAVDLEEGLLASGRVAVIDRRAGLVFIEVDWESFEDVYERKNE